VIQAGLWNRHNGTVRIALSLPVNPAEREQNMNASWSPSEPAENIIQKWIVPGVLGDRDDARATEPDGRDEKPK